MTDEVIKNKGGRPSDYSPELAALICERIAIHDVGLKRLCVMYDDIPEKITINKWRHRHPEFASQYAQAKITQIETLVDEILEIADDTSNDTITDENGTRCNTEFIARSRLKIDTRKWLAAKLVPRVYGKGSDEDKSSADTLVDKLIDKLVLE